MQFNELEHLWKSQATKPFYALDTDALLRQVISNKTRVQRTANISELLLIIVNFGAGAIIIALGIPRLTDYIFMYLLAIWMLLSALYLLNGRRRRNAGGLKFDRTMLGELDHAISVTRYQVRLSQVMRWNILPVGGLVLLGISESGKSTWLILVMMLVFAVGHWIGGWENNIYKMKRHKLETLRSKLRNEEPYEASKTN